ncbi:radical SAM protein [Geothrix sp. PMB-07]|uniref:SPL family radical SAM protein n=1 Tax=Geothrix sp. PMB-07 TaxID=3068640 RepID=UPI002741DA93|nr:radical SAM protein [Geothrix sp. PMB-07]WLT29952.1 radical SAM protein [Geothrix sp. PMB-07]
MTFLPSTLAPPSLFKDLLVEPEEARTILRPQKDERYGFGFALSPYRGCGHGCRYCYVREYPNALHKPSEWGQWVAPKVNAPELLWSQRHKLHNARVFMASATDPYQPLERQYRLTRRCLEVLLLCPTTEVILHTRSPLVLQDLDLLRAFGDRLTVGLSIPTDDDTVRQVVEPHAPAIPSRWAAAERLAAGGVSVTIAVAPLLAVHDAKAFARRARASGASAAWVGGLRLLKEDPFYKVLADQGWLKILNPDYKDGIRAAFQEAFPLKKRMREPRSKPSPASVTIPVAQPGLFDRVG